VLPLFGQFFELSWDGRRRRYRQVDIRLVSICGRISVPAADGSADLARDRSRAKESKLLTRRRECRDLRS
jgi:hypothetical protein